MIRYRDKEFTQYSICPATGEIFDVKTGEVQLFTIRDERPRFKGMLVHRIMAHTFYGYKPGFDVHHLDENKMNNVLSNLVYLTKSEHSILHMTGKEFSVETCANISTAIKGKPKSEEHKAKISASMKGKPRPEEVKAKISAAKKGKHLSKETRAKLSAAHNGMIIWNNGEINRRSKECPGEGWKKGRLKIGA